MRIPKLFMAAFVAINQALAQTVVPFTIDGLLDSVKITNASQFNSGGTVTAYGHAITIPENMLVQFPAAYIPFQKFALDYLTNPGLYTGFEVSLDGNFVNNVPIAGMMSISQFLAGSGAGIVGSVNTDGTMQILGGPLLRINTPNGVYATPYILRPFFTADEENPSISSLSGYPMCIPRSANDPDCPASNRPANGAQVYTPANCSAMAPFLAGDFITWSGIENGPNEILAYEIVAETIQQQTSGDAGQAVYVRLEDVVIGINDGSTTTEVGQTKFTGYSSDSTVGVTIYRVDLDPCTGVDIETQIAIGSLKAGDARNKFDIRISDASVSKEAREYRVRANKGVKIVAKGLQAGQYQAPISELIWPETNVPGIPWRPNPFQLFSQLKDGFAEDGFQYKQLNPWPGAGAPAPSKICTGDELNPPPPPPPPPGATPVANAGPALLSQLAGARIALTGKNTNTVLSDSQLTFAWTGPAGITINDADKSTMNYINPWQDPQTVPTSTRTFTLKVCVSGTTTCNSSSTTVTTDKFVDNIAITSYQYASKQSGTLSLAAISNNLLTGSNGANLQFQIAGTTTWTFMVQDQANPGQYTFSNRNMGRQPTSISVRSSKNPTPVSTTAFVKRALRGLKQRAF
ncbi:hypothetical protein BT63DRAFT_461787 [Microthyrium microscopicum]|uniref:Uncharacterized protein n=1 Tax=Microthyrium microscopicum TaxID=703497 RepID=A0A6A6UPA8_9PEZI|nr:hypothetical protein BT63DRAFT_461787 [Microthyrium microscopicum]